MSRESPSSDRLSKKPGKISVLIADDHPLLRQSLKNIIENEPGFEVIGEASDGEEAVKIATESEPDVVVMDIGMPGMNGLEATRQIKALRPNIAVLVLTIHSDDQSILGILQAGAAGYLTKSVFAEEVVQSIRGVVAGEMVLSPAIGQRLLQHAARFPTKTVQLSEKGKLSTREIEILKLAARGLRNSDIASTMGLSLRTVKGKLSGIFAKLYVASRTEAVTTAIQMGIISMDDIR